MVEWFCYGLAIGAVMGGSIGAIIVAWIIADQDRRYANEKVQP